MSGRLPVAVLGATGAVGQTFIRLLDGHPFFRVAEVAASPRSVGRPYAEAATWREGELPSEVGSLIVRACDPGEISSRIVFSALDSQAAPEVDGGGQQIGCTEGAGGPGRVSDHPAISAKRAANAAAAVVVRFQPALVSTLMA